MSSSIWLRIAQTHLGWRNSDISLLTPAKKWYGKKPDLTKLETLGSLWHAILAGPKRKLDNRNTEAIFIGCALNSYKHGDPERKMYFVP